MMLDPMTQPASTAPDRPSPSFPREMLGNTLITIDHPKFLDGYLDGYTQYTQIGSYLPHSGTTLREVLLERCTSQPGQPGAASTGYVLGWITALQGLPRRQRLCPLETAPFVHAEENTINEPVLEDAIPSLFAHPDFQRGLKQGRASYRADDLFPGEADHPSEAELVHFFGGQVSYKAHYKHYQGQVSYPYRIGFALAQLNAAVEKMGMWPASAQEACPEEAPEPQLLDKETN